MSKKRPRDPKLWNVSTTPPDSKFDPAYWARRLFRSRYTYQGTSKQVRHWSVKIQHRGRRATFSLMSSARSQAAREAGRLYQALRTHGWAATSRLAVRWAGTSSTAGEIVPSAARLKLSYWEQRLIRREYTMNLHPDAQPELSVRVEHEGLGYYFPLATEDREKAAERALRIHRAVVSQGWEFVHRRYRRELTVAFRWLDSPLAWTYTTIHTQKALPAEPARPLATNGVCNVAIAESDAGIRNALAWCINHTEGFRCSAVFANPAQALREIRQRPHRLVLVSHSFPEKPGTLLQSELKAVAPDIPSALYSTYEESELLFKSTPGGAGAYLLQRAIPTRFLEPVAEFLKGDSSSNAEMAAAVWQYFRDSIARLPIASSLRPLTQLTQREHDVLALLSRGHPDKDIADRLAISIYTAREHVRNIFEKLGVHNRTEAVVKFLQK